MKNILICLILVTACWSNGSDSMDSVKKTISKNDSIPNLSSINKINQTGNILFWIGQAKWFMFVNGVNSTGELYTDLSLFLVSEIGLGINFYSNTKYRSAYRKIGGNEDFIRKGPAWFYIFSKAVLLASAGSMAYGVSHDEDNYLIAGAIGVIVSDAINIYTWNALRQSNNELKDNIINWNTSLYFDGAKLKLALNYVF